MDELPEDIVNFIDNCCVKVEDVDGEEKEVGVYPFDNVDKEAVKVMTKKTYSENTS